MVFVCFSFEWDIMIGTSLNVWSVFDVYLWSYVDDTTHRGLGMKINRKTTAVATFQTVTHSFHF